MSTQQPDIRSIPLAAITFSTTPAQVERRAHFSDVAMQELAESVKAEGVIQPIVVRPCQSRDDDRETFEVVAGERRVRACELAGLETVPSLVRDLDDHQVARIQLIENLQREEVHPLSEALGYQELLDKHGYSVDQVADEVGKSKAYVYARLKLLALSAEARKAFYAGKLSASTALLVARIPLEKLQKEALKDITETRYNGGEPMSYREAADHIQRKFMLRLDQAPFDTGDETLVRNIVACGRCPKNTASQPELFADVSTKAHCTDPTCFASKKAAGLERAIEQAEAKGQHVIRGTDAKRIAPNGEYGLRDGYVRLDGHCSDDPKHRTNKQILGRGAKPELLLAPSGDLVPIIQQNAVKAALKEQGVTPTSSRSGGLNSGSGADKVAREKRQHEEAFRIAVLQAIRMKAPKQLDRADLEAIAIGLWESDYGDDAEVTEQLGWEKPSGTAHDRFERQFSSQVKSVSQPELNGLILFLLLRHYAHGNQDFTARSESLLAAAKRMKIDTDRIRKELAAAGKAKTPAPAKAAKKKVAKR